MADLPPGFVVDDPLKRVAPTPGGLPPGFTLDPARSPPRASEFSPPTEQPGALQSIANFAKGPLATMAIRGLSGIPDALSDPLGTVRGLISPELETIEKSNSLGRGIGDTAFAANRLLSDYVPAARLEEYQATTSPSGRTAMAAGTGAISGAPFGLARSGLQAGGALARALPSALAALSSAAGQTVRETLPGYERLAAVAELAPSAGMSAYRAFGPRSAEVPTTTELRDVGRQQRAASGNFGVEVDRGELARRMRTHEQQLYTDGVDPLDIPQTLRAIEQRVDTQGGPLTFANLHTVRRALGRIIDRNQAKGPMSPGNPTEAEAALGMRRQLDDYITTLDANPQHVSVGAANAGEAAQAFRDFLGNYAAAMRSNRITGDLRRGISGIAGEAQALADTQPGAGNYDRSLRSKIRQFLGNDRNLQGFSDEEIAALNAARTGGVARNTARGVAATLGGTPSFQSLTSGGVGSGLAHMLGAGPYTTAFIGGGLPVAGVAARALQNNLARRAIGQADETVRQNSPEYRARLENLPARDQAVLMSVLPGLLAPQPAPPAATDPITAEWMKASGMDARFTPGGSPQPVLDMLQRLLAR